MFCLLKLVYFVLIKTKKAHLKIFTVGIRFIIFINNSNIYMAANLIFLEPLHGVGYSYRDASVSQGMLWSDDKVFSI
ncbi:unnamed protein product [Onchocerca flexuosa]|uniref:Secreted protein n=1 Tax=Onchocerca flexuosa TaxID=387005 RepID=A0A183H9B8_9BILA|nr:unnamed protein product [Onchocerca flexuosa]